MILLFYFSLNIAAAAAAIDVDVGKILAVLQNENLLLYFGANLFGVQINGNN